MKILNLDKTVWHIARKTKSIKAKPLISLLVDRSVTNKFLIDALEGKEPLKDGVVICLGQEMDIWQQMPKKLLQKYDVVGIDNDGWMDCEPRPDNAVNCTQILFGDFEDGNFFIIGGYGETIDGIENVQKGEVGDFVCQAQDNPLDMWIVKKRIFENTYSITKLN
jgi:hypothetical protein